MLNNTKRGRGKHYKPGEIKKAILLFLLDYPKGIDEPTLRDHFKITFQINEAKNIKNHLSDLRKNRCIKKIEKQGYANRWVIDRIQHVKRIVEKYPNVLFDLYKNVNVIEFPF